MKILLVSHSYPPLGNAGTETYTAQVAGRLANRGHEVEVFTTAKDIARPNLSLHTRVHEGVRVHEVFNNLYYERFRESWDYPSIEPAFDGVLASGRFDVVHFQHLMYLSVGCVEKASAREIPIVFTLHDYWLQCPRFGQRVHADGGVCHTIDFGRCGTCLSSFKYGQSPLEKRVGQAIGRVRETTGVNLAPLARGVAGALSKPPASSAERGDVDAAHAAEMERAARERTEAMRSRVLPHVRTFLAPSRFLRERFVKEWAMPDGQIEHLPLGVEVDAFLAQERVRADRIRVAFVGSLIPIKGPHLLLEAWGRLAPELRQRASLTLYGPSQHDPAFQRRLGELAASVGAELGGRIERSDMPVRLASIDLLVVPSVWFENSPLVILEARAARTPLLVSDLGGMAELVERGRSGEHFRVGDVDDLARGLTALLADRARLAALSERSVPPPSVDDHVGELEMRFESVRRMESR